MSKASRQKQYRKLVALEQLRKAVAAQELAEAEAFEEMRRSEEGMARAQSQQAFENWLICLSGTRLDTHQLETSAHALTLSEAQLLETAQAARRAAIRTEGSKRRHAERCVQAGQAQEVLGRLLKRAAQDRQEDELEIIEDRISYAWGRA